ncbi:MAG TPA: glycosyl hydrolase family 28-related protein [Terracidiphilus sp.]|jgi:hypothetical protein
MRILPLLLSLSLPACAQPWSPILHAGQAVSWSDAGVGAIPARSAICATLQPAAGVSEINAALASCPKDHAVYLAPGTYQVDGTIQVPSHVTLRGAGADRTILNAKGVSGGFVVSLGGGYVPYHPINITGGATAGSARIAVAGGPIALGQYLVITETNDPSYVSSEGSEGTCKWCDSGWTPDGQLARGQIVRVTGVGASGLTIAPALYSKFTRSPVAVPITMSASYAGVEDLQVYANNTGYAASFGLVACAYCWVKGVESNYADGDYVRVYWGYRDEIRDSYFSNAYLHKPGVYDSDIQIGWKTTATLVENNIIERGHVSIMIVWGAAGNVIAYNYTMGEFDTRTPDFLIGGIFFHGAHPQFNLLEGNVVSAIFADSIWGTSSDTTAFRNWVVGTSRICSPLLGRGPVKCSASDGHYASQAARAMQIFYLSTRNNFIGNVIGSAQMQSLLGYGKALPQVAQVEYPAPRSYDGAVYGWTFGYGEASDTGKDSGCAGGIAPCHLAGTARTDFFHANYNHIDKSIVWAPGLAHALPPSFYLAGKPAWWGDMPFPATGPDITTGNGPAHHSYGNPAQACYVRVMGGSDGGQGSPLRFNAAACYGTHAGLGAH